MSVSAAKSSLGPSLLGSIGSLFQAPAAGNAPAGVQDVGQAIQALTQNPIFRSLLGESGFDGAQGAGKTDKAAKASEASNPQEMLQKILDTLKQLMSVLETMAGKKPGAEGGEQAGGPEGAQQAGGPQGAQQPGGPEQAAGPQGPGAAQEEDENDPIKKLMKALQQIAGIISQLQQALGGQGGAPAPAAAPAAAPVGGA